MQVSESPDISVTEASSSGPDEQDEPTTLSRLAGIQNPRTGLITGVRQIPVPADEPAIAAYVVEREDFEPFTDGQAMAHEEGGAAFADEAARVATYGEAIERYCGCLYQEAALRTAAYTDLTEPALDPTAVVNFSEPQRRAVDEGTDLCERDDELSWVAGEALDTGDTAFVPAQLVYLSYPPAAEPFIRNPVSSGLAAGESREMAIHNGCCELVERDAFMTYYLTETELPGIDPASAPPRVRRLIDRVTAHGLAVTLLDATTDLGIPVVIAVLIDREASPAVTVAAAAGRSIPDVIESALAEAVQTRLSAIHRLDATDRSPADVAVEEITEFADRALFWAAQDRISDLDFWIDSDRETTVDAMEPDDDSPLDPIERVTAAGYDLYAVDVTTRDVSNLGCSVQRVIAPRLQPLYLVERLRYFGGERLYETPVEMGYRDTKPRETDLNTVPHPFP
ncbi:MAG: thiazole/oxazole-forming peptide maturase, SagD family component [uncultured archaeon A07HN63]|nr:MAG: thiazole/oxazole-forming peptide maturase, SagD family component [uncultured archaeon A07HN63]